MELTDAERQQLARILGREVSELDEALEGYAAAAKEEYVRMILGQRVFTRGQDVREYRLLLLVQHVFGGRLPTEPQVSRLFQTTATQSRALLRAVVSKYQYELQAAVDRTLDDVLATARQDPETQAWLVTVDSETVVEALNRRLAEKDGTLPQVLRARSTVSTYEIANSAYRALTGR